MGAIRPEDLQRLAEMAFEDQATFFRRYPDIAKVYRDRLLCVALCQGAAEGCTTSMAGMVSRTSTCGRSIGKQRYGHSLDGDPASLVISATLVSAEALMRPSFVAGA